jgi:hypothetical protein
MNPPLRPKNERAKYPTGLITKKKMIVFLYQLGALPRKL